ncbi:hypothetical protein C8R45DRAFT_938809 [Mycena sanguinolenta]|nr:hypothetical protein C8R45DRAFT_938809 [Mycena sanguinolenta]
MWTNILGPLHDACCNTFEKGETKWRHSCRASWWSAVKHIQDSKTALSIVNRFKEEARPAMAGYLQTPVGPKQRRLTTTMSVKENGDANMQSLTGGSELSAIAPTRRVQLADSFSVTCSLTTESSRHKSLQDRVVLTRNNLRTPISHKDVHDRQVITGGASTIHAFVSCRGSVRGSTDSLKLRLRFVPRGQEWGAWQELAAGCNRIERGTRRCSHAKSHRGFRIVCDHPRATTLGVLSNSHHVLGLVKHYEAMASSLTREGPRDLAYLLLAASLRKLERTYERDSAEAVEPATHSSWTRPSQHKTPCDGNVLTSDKVNSLSDPSLVTVVHSSTSPTAFSCEAPTYGASPLMSCTQLRASWSKNYACLEEGTVGAGGLKKERESVGGTTPLFLEPSMVLCTCSQPLDPLVRVCVDWSTTNNAPPLSSVASSLHSLSPPSTVVSTSPTTSKMPVLPSDDVSRSTLLPEPRVATDKDGGGLDEKHELRAFMPQETHTGGYSAPAYPPGLVLSRNPRWQQGPSFAMDSLESTAPLGIVRSEGLKIIASAKDS